MISNLVTLFIKESFRETKTISSVHKVTEIVIFLLKLKIFIISKKSFNYQG